VWTDGEGHLLITDSLGRQIGFVGDAFVNEIPGAYASPVLGGLGAGREPIYSIPLDDTYEVLVNNPPTEILSPSSIALFGSEHVIKVDGLSPGSSSQGLLTVNPDGTQVSFGADGAQEVSLTQVLEGVDDGLVFLFQGVDLSSGDQIQLDTDLVGGVQEFINGLTGGGLYNLMFKQSDQNGQEAFIHNDVGISPTDTHFVNFGDWDGSGTMSVEIDFGSDGSIDDELLLSNQLIRIFLALIAIQ